MLRLSTEAGIELGLTTNQPATQNAHLGEVPDAEPIHPFLPQLLLICLLSFQQSHYECQFTVG